jgi:hypothetical protein
VKEKNQINLRMINNTEKGCEDNPVVCEDSPVSIMNPE